MALVASQISELQALDMTLATLAKIRKAEARARGGFPGDKALCVVHCLRAYEDLTQESRSGEEYIPQPLLLSHVKQFTTIQYQLSTD